MTHTLYANRFDEDSRQHRLVSLVVMALMVVLSIFAEDSLGAGFAYFAAVYAIVRLILASLYLHVHFTPKLEVSFAKNLALGISAGAIVSASAIAFEGNDRFLVFYLGLSIDAGWQIYLRDKMKEYLIHREHLVERMGLLAIIILGESMIAMVASLSSVNWDLLDMIAAATGFILIGSIWWVYFDSFPKLESAKRLTSGKVLIFTHLLVCMGLLILANMIRHAILGDLDQQTFGLLAVTGFVCFYLGKQIPYWYAFPPWRVAIVTNTVVCISITIASAFLLGLEYALLGMTIGMLIYVYLTFKRILSVGVDEFLGETE